MDWPELFASFSFLMQMYTDGYVHIPDFRFYMKVAYSLPLPSWASLPRPSLSFAKLFFFFPTRVLNLSWASDGQGDEKAVFSLGISRVQERMPIKVAMQNQRYL